MRLEGRAMRHREIRRRIERLGHHMPRAAQLLDREGRILFESWATPSETLSELLERVREGEPDIVRILIATAGASKNFGKLWQLLRSLALSQEEYEGQTTIQ